MRWSAPRSSASRSPTRTARHSRVVPVAALRGGCGYDARASSGSNYGPENEDLLTAIEDRRAAIEELDGSDQIPTDALTASGSGLDPHISPDYALLQVPRVADARGSTCRSCATSWSL